MMTPEKMQSLPAELLEVPLAGPGKNAWTMSAYNVSMTKLSMRGSSLT